VKVDKFRWTRADLAEAFGVTPMRISQLVNKERVLPKPVQGNQYDSKAAIAAYVKHLQTRQTKQEKEKAETEKLHLDNALKRLRLDRATGELMSKDAVKHAWFSAGREIRDTLENLPDRLAGPLASETDQTAIFSILNHELRQLLEMLSKVPDVKAKKNVSTV